jgi:hypothetical protein
MCQVAKAIWKGREQGSVFGEATKESEILDESGIQEKPVRMMEWGWQKNEE